MSARASGYTSLYSSGNAEHTGDVVARRFDYPVLLKKLAHHVLPNANSRCRSTHASSSTKAALQFVFPYAAV